MENNRTSRRNLISFTKIYEIILCLYIVVVPIINSIDDIVFFGYGIHVWIVCALLAMAVVINFIVKSSYRNKIGFPKVILVFFVIEILIQSYTGGALDISLLLLIFAYVAFLKTPKNISVKKIYIAFYISVLIAAVYSVIGGLVAGKVTRTATLVDGSIAIVTILIAFFGKETFHRTRGYNFLKFIAIISCFVVALFGMSRSRILILATVVFIKIFLMLKHIIERKKVDTTSLLAFPIIIIMIVVLLRVNVVQALFDAISIRFENMFESMGRNIEIKKGWKLFLEHPILGNGWGKMKYTDHQSYITDYANHCMYVAILARGGIVMGTAFFLSFISLIRNIVKKRCGFFCYITLLTFFALGYGNAGIFNYTICSMFIPLMLNLNCDK